MSEEEIIKICRILCGKKNKKGKREYPLFANLQLQLDYSNDELAEAIEGLLDLYIAEKEKNKALKEGLKYRINYCKLLEKELYANGVNYEFEKTEIEKQFLE